MNTTDRTEGVTAAAEYLHRTQREGLGLVLAVFVIATSPIWLDLLLSAFGGAA